MAIGDFMHKQLINAASRDALATIGAGAAVGGGAGAVNGLLSDNNTMIGGALSGAMLGAGAGAGLRYAGNKYGAGILAEAKVSNETGKFNTNFFTKAGKDEGLDFFGDHSAAMAVHREAANKTADAAPSAAQGVNKAGEPPVAGTVNTSSGAKNISREANERVNQGNAKDVIDATKKIREEQKEARSSYAGEKLIRGPSNPGKRTYRGPKETQQAIKNADEYNRMQDSLSLAEKVEPSIVKRTSGELDAAEAAFYNNQAKANYSPTTGSVRPKQPVTLPGVSSFASDSSSSTVSMGKKKFGSGKTTLSENINAINNSSSPAPVTFGEKTLDMGNKAVRDVKKVSKGLSKRATEQAQLSDFRSEAIRDHLTQPSVGTRGLSNLGGPSASLNDVLKYMNGV